MNDSRKSLSLAWRVYLMAIYFFAWFSLGASLLSNLSFWIGHEMDIKRYFIRGLFPMMLALMLPAQIRTLLKSPSYSQKTLARGVVRYAPKTFCLAILGIVYMIIGAVLLATGYAGATENFWIQFAVNSFMIAFFSMCVLCVVSYRLVLENRIGEHAVGTDNP